MESDYDDCCYIIYNGQTVPGLEMASKAFIIIRDAELTDFFHVPTSPNDVTISNKCVAAPDRPKLEISNLPHMPDADYRKCQYFSFDYRVYRDHGLHRI